MKNINVQYTPKAILELPAVQRSALSDMCDFRKAAPIYEAAHDEWRQQVEDGDAPRQPFDEACAKVCGISYAHFHYVTTCARVVAAIRRHVDKTNRPLAYMLRHNIATIPAETGVSHFIPLLRLENSKAQYKAYMRALVLAQGSSRGLLARHVEQAVQEIQYRRVRQGHIEADKRRGRKAWLLGTQRAAIAARVRAAMEKAA